MHNELILLIKNHTGTSIEQTKSRPEETLEFMPDKQKGTFFSSPPIHLAEKKRLLALTSFEATNPVFNITDENNSFLINIPGHCKSEKFEEVFNKLKKLLELRSENDIE